jgi:phytoene dehydrogenase-like protein
MDSEWPVDEKSTGFGADSTFLIRREVSAVPREIDLKTSRTSYIWRKFLRMKPKILIIGGGVAGLSAGIYAAANGFDTEILEMHSVPGGQCTAWMRKQFRFDYCLHWLVGTSGGVFHDIWKETGVLDDTTEIIDHEIHSRITDTKGREFTVYSDIDRWENYLLNLAPEDEKTIRKMCRTMRKSALLEPFALPPELRGPMDYLRPLPKMIPLLPVLAKYGRMTCREYFDKLGFKSERLRTALYSMYGERNFSAMAFLFMLGWFHQKNAGYVKGGSFPLTQRMAAKFERLGGRLSCNCRVEKILVENSVTRGVVLSDETRLNADYVISAADGYSTIYRMLDGNYLSKEIEHAYTQWELFTSFVQVSFGIGRELFSEAPVVLDLTPGISIGRTVLPFGYSVMNYGYDSTMAPAGKTTIVMRFDSPWELWKDLEGEAYREEKNKILADALQLLEQHFPGISASVEATDVATPKTCVRYTGVREGAYEGFMPTRDNMMTPLKMQLPGLKNFYMAGQWLFPGGGLPPSAQSGKWAVMLICKTRRQVFVS